MHKANLSRINLVWGPLFSALLLKSITLNEFSNLVTCPVKLSFLSLQISPTSEESLGFLSYEQTMESCLYAYLSDIYGSRKGGCHLDVYVYCIDLSVLILLP